MTGVPPPSVEFFFLSSWYHYCEYNGSHFVCLYIYMFVYCMLKRQTCFFWCDASYLLFLKITAKLYLICFQAERQSRRKLTSFFSRQTCGNYLDIIALSCNANIIGRQIHISRVWLLSGSLHTLSFCMLFTYIYVYMFNLYSPFFSSNLWIWITVHVNSCLQSIVHH